MITDISDHLSNFTILDIKTPSIKDRPYVRLFTEKNIEKFNENITSEQPLISSNDLTETNFAFERFSSNYQNLFDKYFPYVRMSRRQFKNKPHITQGIKVSIRYKNKLYHKYLNNPTDVNRAAWKNLRLTTIKAYLANIITVAKISRIHLEKFSIVKKLNTTNQ